MRSEERAALLASLEIQKAALTAALREMASGMTMVQHWRSGRRPSGASLAGAEHSFAIGAAYLQTQQDFLAEIERLVLAPSESAPNDGPA